MLRESVPGASALEPKIADRLEKAGYPAPPTAIPLLAAHLAMTLKWAKAISLTSIRSVDEAIDRHILESAVAAARVDEARGRHLDIGSGNGYPAIPIKILRPGLRSTLLEPHLRRSVFLGQVASTLALEGIDVRRQRVDRAEELRAFAPLGTISMRAVGALEAVLGGAASALVAGGGVLLFLGENDARGVGSHLPFGLVLEESVPLPHRLSARLVVLRRQP